MKMVLVPQKDHGYTERVSIDDCSRWSKEEK